MGLSKMIYEPKVYLAQTMHLYCIQMDQNEVPHDSRHVGVPFGASKKISEPMVCSTRTMHLSCVKISSISKRTKMRFHMTHVT
jgi:hypothetical protein